MKDFLRQNGILLLVIALLLSVLIGISSAFLGGQADPLSNMINVVVTPIRSGIASAADWMEGVYTYVFHYGELEAEITELRAQVAGLEEQVRQGEEASRENEQRRELLALQARRRDFVFESVKVTARSTSNWESTLTLSKGSTSGIQAGDCVITATGVLVGVVSETGTNWSTVLTLVDTDTSLGAQVFRTKDLGVAQGDFSMMRENRLRLDYLPPDCDPMAGDIVVTSGLNGYYPSGLVIGSVEEVRLDDSGAASYATLIPAADFDALTEVFVIKSFEIVT